MNRTKEILIRIKDLVKKEEPNATIILYGSSARGDNRKDSDIDLLILIDKDKISPSDERRVKYPLYDLEFDTGQIISPLIFARQEWEVRHKITALYANIKREGIYL